MQRSFWSRTVSFFTRAQQPSRKVQSKRTWTGNGVEHLETRTLLSAVDVLSTQLSPLQNQEAHYSEEVSFQLEETSDAGKTLTYDVSINADPYEMVAKRVDELHGIYATETYVGTNYHFNRRGHNEKYMLGETGWYFILPTGDVYRWNRNIEESRFVAHLDTSYYDNPELLYTAGDSSEMERYAADVDHEWDFYASDSVLAKKYYENLRGQGEKYIQSGNKWFYITPDGATYRWYGSIEKSEKYFQFDPSYHEDPSKLFDAYENFYMGHKSDEADIVVDGNEVTITPKQGFLGTFNYTVLATDGFHVSQTTRSFEVQNTAPQVSDIGPVEFLVYPEGSPEGAPHVLFHSDGTLEDLENAQAAIDGRYLTLDLDGHDTDGDQVSFSVAFAGADAVLLTEKYDLHADAKTLSKNYYYNLRGANEKYVQTDRGWVYLLPNGEAYRWYGSLEKANSLPNWIVPITTIRPGYGQQRYLQLQKFNTGWKVQNFISIPMIISKVISILSSPPPMVFRVVRW
ncbi:MAG: hypothetical protein R3C11_07230 [Planctomycetaceae bacterium]